MSDRRRINAPPGGTAPPIFTPSASISRPQRTRSPSQPRKIFLRTGLVPSASGSSAAIADAGIDCVDLIAGGVAAAVKSEGAGNQVVVLDPCPSEHAELGAACVVGYLQSRDEITELWMRGDAGDASEAIIDRAVEAASLTRTVLADTIRDAAQQEYGAAILNANGAAKGAQKQEDIDMTG
ncbi:3'-5'-exoribonuclease [Taxawa tesnikishii (nom. ined.)]|nr:3'-5'-exoribonuclease [Dothideales sp. JES 119]